MDTNETPSFESSGESASVADFTPETTSETVTETAPESDNQITDVASESAFDAPEVSNDTAIGEAAESAPETSQYDLDTFDSDTFIKNHEQQFSALDSEIIKSAYSENPEDRMQFHQKFYEQSPVAYQRFISDIINDETVVAQILEKHADRLQPQADEFTQAAGSNAYPDIVEALPTELRDVFKALPQEVQDEYALQAESVRNWNLERVGKAMAQEKAEQQRAQQQQIEAQNQQRQQIETQKQRAYEDVRSSVSESLKKLFPNDADALSFAVDSIETELFRSEKGRKLWSELDAHISQREKREFDRKLPLMVTEAMAVAAKRGKYLANLHSDARKWRESQQKTNDRLEPNSGNPVSRQNVNLPNPSAAGDYSPENILRYWQEATSR